MYIETSLPRVKGDKAWLISTNFPFSQTARCMQFWYHMYGDGVGMYKFSINKIRKGHDVADNSFVSVNISKDTEWIKNVVQSIVLYVMVYIYLDIQIQTPSCTFDQMTKCLKIIERKV